MTTATATLNNGTLVAGEMPRPSLEELVDRVMEAIFAANRETPQAQTVARNVHDARRLRQAGDLDGALAVFAGADTDKADTNEARWAYAEWLGLVRKRFGHRDLLVYRQGTGRAAALAPHEMGTVEVLAVLGLRWQPGKMVSAKSLRGLRSLEGGKSWS